MRSSYIVALLAACFLGCASPVRYETELEITKVETVTSSRDANVTTEDLPAQYFVSCRLNMVEDGEQTTLTMPKLIILGGQEATAFVGENDSDGAVINGTEVRLFVTENGDAAEALATITHTEDGELIHREERTVAIEN